MNNNINYNYGILIFGKHSVINAITSGKRNIYKIMVTKNNFTNMQEILRNFSANLLPKLQIVTTEYIDQAIADQSVHQGFLLHCSKLNPTNLSEIIINANKVNNYKIVILDNVTDTRNIGSIIRSAVAFNINALIIAKNNYTETSAMVKASSGTIDNLTIATVANLATTLQTLKENNFWIIGLSANTTLQLHEIDKFNKTALIFGSEGFGMKQLTEKKCDFIAKININNTHTDSLNISNAAAIAFYELNK